MTRIGQNVFGTLLSTALLIAAGCSSSNGSGSGGSGGTAAGTGGTTAGSGGARAGSGGATGSGGTGGAVAGTGGSTSAFMAVNPCNATTDYTTTGTTIAYGGPDLVYQPQCLKVAAGAAVTFMPLVDGEDFSLHQLTPSSRRGTMPNPITLKESGTTATFTFPNPGFFAYYCQIHGSDDGSFMAGVIWVQ